MKLITFLHNSDNVLSKRIGAVMADGKTAADLYEGARVRGGESFISFDDMLALLDGGEKAMDEAREVLSFVEKERSSGSVHELSDIDILSPVPNPRSIRDCMVFEKHIAKCADITARKKFPVVHKFNSLLMKFFGKGMNFVPGAWYRYPLYYKGNTFSVVGHNADIQWPEYTEKLDYELEFGVFIGKKGSDIPASEARKYIAGYSIFNDFSARDMQLEEMEGRLGPAKGKDFDTGNAIGPYLVTIDEIQDPYNLKMTARINGEKWSEGNSRDMYFSFEEMIAHMSASETIYPGEFIASGTVGYGCGLELDRWISPGDIIELEIEGLGALSNKIVRKNK